MGSHWRLAEADETLYSLYAVLVHHDLLGSTAFGHYTCFVKDSKANSWVQINDSKARAVLLLCASTSPLTCYAWVQITKVNKSVVLKQKAYMLFYQRAGSTAPRTRAEPLVFAPQGQATAATASGDGSGQAGEEPQRQLCPGGCGFYGTAEKEGMCSQCFAKAKGLPVPGASKPRTPTAGAGYVACCTCASRDARQCLRGLWGVQLRTAQRDASHAAHADDSANACHGICRPGQRSADASCSPATSTGSCCPACSDVSAARCRAQDREEGWLAVQVWLVRH